MTGTKEDIAMLRAMLADAPTELLIQEAVRRGYTCVPSVPFDLEKELVDEQDEIS